MFDKFRYVLTKHLPLAPLSFALFPVNFVVLRNYVIYICYTAHYVEGLNWLRQYYQTRSVCIIFMLSNYGFDDSMARGCSVGELVGESPRGHTGNAEVIGQLPSCVLPLVQGADHLWRRGMYSPIADSSTIPHDFLVQFPAIASRQQHRRRHTPNTI